MNSNVKVETIQFQKFQDLEVPGWASLLPFTRGFIIGGAYLLSIYESSTRTMAASSLLEPTLNQILAAVKPSSEDTRIRYQVLDIFYAAVQQVEGLRADFREVKLISNARVPIIKFQTRYLNISCDISMDYLIGKMKSKFLGWISGIDERFQDMVLLVKKWAKALDINDSRSGSLNSYIFTHLARRTCVAAILPPLMDKDIWLMI